MSLLGLEDALDGLARASGVRCYGHVLSRAGLSNGQTGNCPGPRALGDPALFSAINY